MSINIGGLARVEMEILHKTTWKRADIYSGSREEARGVTFGKFIGKVRITQETADLAVVRYTKRRCGVTGSATMALPSFATISCGVAPFFPIQSLQLQICIIEYINRSLMVKQ